MCESGFRCYEHCSSTRRLCLRQKSRAMLDVMMLERATSDDDDDDGGADKGVMMMLMMTTLLLMPEQMLVLGMVVLQ